MFDRRHFLSAAAGATVAAGTPLLSRNAQATLWGPDIDDGTRTVRRGNLSLAL